MKKKALLSAIIMVMAAGCSPHLHLDFLGGETLEEIVLVPDEARDKILMIDVEGIISSNAGSGPFSREKNLVSRVYSRLQRAAADPRVRAVILRLDTPGGEVTASDIIHHEILTFRERTQKPVIGLMMGIAASGGYYIASACDVIMAHPASLTGSIGVISIFPSVQGLMGKVGVKINVIKSGEAKDAGGPFRDMSEEDKKIFQRIIDEYYQSFLDAVIANRKGKISPENLRAVADGRVYTARQALRLNLIDEIGYFGDAFKAALSMANLERAKVVGYTYYPKSKTNIYASTLGDFSPLDSKVLESYLDLLKTGFYYLWLPRTL